MTNHNGTRTFCRVSHHAIKTFYRQDFLGCKCSKNQNPPSSPCWAYTLNLAQMWYWLTVNIKKKHSTVRPIKSDDITSSNSSVIIISTLSCRQVQTNIGGFRKYDFYRYRKWTLLCDKQLEIHIVCSAEGSAMIITGIITFSKEWTGAGDEVSLMNSWNISCFKPLVTN